jgi:hypothetical protein
MLLVPRSAQRSSIQSNSMRPTASRFDADSCDVKIVFMVPFYSRAQVIYREKVKGSFSTSGVFEGLFRRKSLISKVLWLGAESNRRHEDFQSCSFTRQSCIRDSLVIYF